jgi:hypothetical protein
MTFPKYSQPVIILNMTRSKTILGYTPRSKVSHDTCDKKKLAAENLLSAAKLILILLLFTSS